MTNPDPGHRKFSLAWVRGWFAKSNHQPNRLISRREKLGACGVFLLIFAMFAFVEVRHWPQDSGDSAFLAEMIDHICSSGKPLTHISGSTFVVFKVLYSPPEVGCGMALGYLPPVNQFHWHTYLISYLIAPFAYIIPTAILLPCLMVFSFVGLLLCIYLYARSRGIPILCALLFSFLVSLHPAWGISIFGQSYIDRLFLILGWLLLAALTAKRPRFQWIFLAGAACTSVNDRAGMFSAMIILGYLILYPQALKGLRFKTAVLAVGLGAISFYLYKYYVIKIAPNFLPPLSQAFHFSDIQKSQLVLMAAVSAPLLFLAAWDWRALLLALILMMPNIFGSIGGAEKIGWGTHYQSYYFSILAWAAFCGFRNFWGRIQANPGHYHWRTIAGTGALLALVAYSLTLNPDSLQLRFESKQVADSSWNRCYALARAYLGPAVYRPVNPFEEVARIIPPGAAISMNEGGTPTFYRGRDIYLFPAGIDEVNYLVLRIKRHERAHYVYSDVSPYTDPVSREKLNECIFGRLAAGGFDLDHPKVFTGDIAVVERRGHPLPTEKLPPPNH